jgi:hypothetical protein
MTAEIAVLNSHGVAMAADSAVSIGGSKVYNSANKLFALTKKQPVGVMVYGNAQMMSVPWEALIKTYRKELKDKKFDSLLEYGEDFIGYLTSTVNIGQENENVFIQRQISMLIEGLKEKIIDEEMQQNLFSINPNPTTLQINKFISDSIKIHCKIADPKDRLDYVYPKWVSSLRRKITPWVNDSIIKFFENTPIKDSEKKLILEMCTSLFYGNFYSNTHTGIVISGFGNAEIFPSLISYEIEWRIMGVLKYRVSNQEKITVTNSATIVPFAQREMVDTFMEGSDRRLIEFLNKELNSIFDNVVEKVFKDTTIRVGKKNLSTIKNNCKSIRQSLAQKLDYVQNANFVRPVLDSVSALPLDELASMAQTLINMTSFKRRVSLNPESVGGPIDVAVISKGDGFIWINRKHYFKPELNQHYMSNNS